MFAQLQHRQHHHSPLSILLLLAASWVRLSDSGAVQLDPSNIDTVLASYEFVFINFYADWCRFSNLLAPIWDEGADKITTELAGQSVLVGRVDCDSHPSLGTRPVLQSRSIRKIGFFFSDRETICCCSGSEYR
jgi:Thioredoxin